MTGAVDQTVINLIVFVLAVFVGYHVVWNVTPALHTPLMSVTNAISSVIIVGAILAAGSGDDRLRPRSSARSRSASSPINIFGGFLVTQRMLEMFKKKDRNRATDRQSSHHRTMTANHVALSYLAGERALHPRAERAFASADGAPRQPVRHGRDGARGPHDARDHAAHRSHARRAGHRRRDRRRSSRGACR